jgi:hypothetical protein
MLMIQTDLQSGDVHLTSWLPQDKRVKLGSRISLDKDPTVWTVMKQYEPIDSSQIQRGWNVGGIETIHN